jgi:hypothetical protein
VLSSSWYLLIRGPNLARRQAGAKELGITIPSSVLAHLFIAIAHNHYWCLFFRVDLPWQQGWNWPQIFVRG